MMEKEKVLELNVFVAEDNSVSSSIDYNTIFLRHLKANPSSCDEFLVEMVEILKKHINGV